MESTRSYRITGRVKDLFKSAKGKYVVPVPIESKLSGDPMLEQICVMGSGLRTPVAVAVLSQSANSTSNHDVAESIAETLDAVNQTLESHEKIDRVVLVNDEWTIENELLTPTMKIKRDLLEEKYRKLISADFPGKVQWEN